MHRIRRSAPTPSTRVALTALAALAALAACGSPVRPERPVPLPAAEPAGAAAGPGAPPPGPAPRVAWRARFDRAPSALAADRHGAVVFVGEREVVALDPRGRVRWRTAVAGLGYEAPALATGLVLVAANTGIAEDATGEVVALDRATGARRWSVRSGWAGPVALGPGLAYSTTVAGVVTASDRETGVPVWRRRLPGLVAPGGALAVDARARVVATVWLARDGRFGLDALDAATGTRRYRVDLGAGPPPTAVAAARGLLVVGDGSAPAVRAVDAATGAPRWSTPSPAGFDPVTVPAVRRGLVALADAAGNLAAYDLAGGVRRWSRPLGLPVPGAHPVLAGGRVALATWEGDVVLASAATGRLAAVRPAGLAVRLAAGGRRLLVALRLADPPRVEAWVPGRPAPG